MKALTDSLWRKLAAFSFDLPGARLPFTARLARDNAWSLTFAHRVLDEYRRFLYLAVRAGHPVTPSDAVDQAWHLHLVYTESYWNDLCPHVLGQPLHHGPTKGGHVENAKFEDWYERTRDSYRAHFGEAPPADIWPPSAVRFGPASRGQRVSPHEAWIIPKPDFLRRRTAPTVFAISLAPLALLAVGDGDGFLWFFAAFVVVAIIVSIVRHKKDKGDRGGCGAGGTGCGGGGGSSGGKGSGCGSDGGSGCGGGGCGGGGGD